MCKLPNSVGRSQKQPTSKAEADILVGTYTLNEWRKPDQYVYL